MYEEFVECRYCKFATALAHSPLEMLCEKRGVVAAGGKCKKFDLDLLSITPPPKKRSINDKKDKFKADDFAI